MTHTTRQTDSQVELCIAHGTGQTAKNKATFKALEAQKVAIEADFGAPLDWQELPAGEGCRIRYVVDGAGPVSWRLALKLGLRDGQCLTKLGGSQGARARALVAGLAVQSELCSAAFVARHFKRAKATLCEQMAASRRRVEDQRLLAVPMRDVLSEAVKLRAQNRSDGRR